MIRLKNLTLRTPVIQSPMAGCTDLAFRLIARQHGMKFAFLEMVSADALIRKNSKTFELLKTAPKDKPLGVQLFGSNPKNLGEAAAMIEAMGFDWLDLNFGCPVHKITAGGSGSALLCKPDLAKKIFEAVVTSVRKIPVTVKMRKGYTDPSGIEAVKIAHLAEDAGIDAITVHGRTRAQGYSGKADWDSIRKVKEAVTIPVFGNGDIFSGKDATEMVRLTGCDGVMIGRGALGNPWIYKSVAAALKGAKAPRLPSPDELKKVALKHLDLEIKFEGERQGLLRGRKIICWYFKSLPGSAVLRNHVNRSLDVKEVQKLIRDFGSC